MYSPQNKGEKERSGNQNSEQANGAKPQMTAVSRSGRAAFALCHSGRGFTLRHRLNEPFCSALRINAKDEGRDELGEFGETLRWPMFSHKKNGLGGGREMGSEASRESLEIVSQE